MKKSVSLLLYALFALCACAGLFYILRVSTADTVREAPIQTVDATQEQKSGGEAPAEEVSVIAALAAGETLVRASVEFPQSGEDARTIEIECQEGVYTLTQPVECEIEPSVFERYIGAVFTLKAIERLNVEAAKAYAGAQETCVKIETNQRVISLCASAPVQGECIVVDIGNGGVYRVDAQAAAWRGASVPTLTGRLFFKRTAQETCAFDMYTHDGEYHFMRTQQETTLNGAQADEGDFERMVETLLSLPLTYLPDASAQKEEDVALTLTYEDGEKDEASIFFAKEQAYITLGDGQTFRTDAWRVHALAIACDGARWGDAS